MIENKPLMPPHFHAVSYAVMATGEKRAKIERVVNLIDDTLMTTKEISRKVAISHQRVKNIINAYHQKILKS